MKKLLLISTMLISATSLSHAQGLATNGLARAPSINVCSGSEKGSYYTAMNMIMNRVNVVNKTIVDSTGSLDNLKLLENGQCDVFITQSDAKLYYNTVNKSANLKYKIVEDLYLEAAQLICASYTNVKTIDDLSKQKDRTVVIGSGGGAITWDLMSYSYPALKSLSVNRNADPSSQNTLNRVKSSTNKDIDCLFYVSGLSSDTMKRVDANGTNLNLINITNPAITTALVESSTRQPIYTTATILPGTYPNLQSGVFYSNAPVRTIVVKAQLGVSEKIYSNQVLYTSIVEAVKLELNNIRRLQN